MTQFCFWKSNTCSTKWLLQINMYHSWFRYRRYWFQVWSVTGDDPLLATSLYIISIIRSYFNVTWPDHYFLWRPRTNCILTKDKQVWLSQLFVLYVPVVCIVHACCMYCTCMLYVLYVPVVCIVRACYVYCMSL